MDVSARATLADEINDLLHTHCYKTVRVIAPATHDDLNRLWASTIHPPSSRHNHRTTCRTRRASVTQSDSDCMNCMQDIDTFTISRASNGDTSPTTINPRTLAPSILDDCEMQTYALRLERGWMIVPLLTLRVEPSEKEWAFQRPASIIAERSIRRAFTAIERLKPPSGVCVTTGLTSGTSNSIGGSFLSPAQDPHPPKRINDPHARAVRIFQLHKCENGCSRKSGAAVLNN